MGQDPGPLPTSERSPATSPIDQARELFREGSALAAQGEWSEALRFYQAAYDRYAHSTTLYNIAYCHAQLGRLTLAWYRTVQALDPAGLDPSRGLSAERRPAAIELRDELRARLAVLTLRTDLPAGEVRLDGRSLTAVQTGAGRVFIAAPESEPHSTAAPELPSSATLYVDPGAHELRITSAGRARARRIELSEGEQLTLTFLDVGAASTAPSASKLPARKRAQRALNPAEATGPNYLRPVGYGSLALGGAGFVLALVAGIVTLDSTDRLDDACAPDGSCPESEADAISRYQTAATLTNMGLFVGVGATAAGVGLLLLSDSSAQNEPNVALRLSPAGQATISGSFR